MPPEEKRQLRGKRIAYLAQSAAATFNPALTIGEQVIESVILDGLMSQDEANQPEDQAAVTAAHTVNDRARSIR